MRASLSLIGVLIALVAACLGRRQTRARSSRSTKQHPIRGFFGDPRTVYLNGVLSGGLRGRASSRSTRGSTSPRQTGRRSTRSRPERRTTSAQRRSTSTRGPTRRVTRSSSSTSTSSRSSARAQVYAKKTILGYVQPPFQHVHLTEINGTHSVNPLGKGHLTPYVDHTRPTIRDLSFRNQTGTLQTPLGLCGRIELAVDAFDRPPVPVPGKFSGLPVAPGLVRWTSRAPWPRSSWRSPPTSARSPRQRALHRPLRQGHVRERAALRQPAIHVDAWQVSLPARRRLDTTSLANGVYSSPPESPTSAATPRRSPSASRC